MTYLWGILCHGPVVPSTLRFLLRLVDFGYEFAYGELDDRPHDPQMSMKSKLHRECGEEFVRDHRHLDLSARPTT